MSSVGNGDMSAAWLAHAPPPPPTSDVRKPRRSSSYEPLAGQKGISSQPSTNGGYLPPSSHSPEPDRPRRTSISGATAAPLSQAPASAPVSPVKRVRSKVASNPPAPSAFYNYQHQLQQQQQQQQQQQHVYHQQVQPSVGYPSSVPMAYAQSESTSSQDALDYARDRRGSAPAAHVSYPNGYDYGASQFQQQGVSTLPYAPHPQMYPAQQQYYAPPPPQQSYPAMQPQPWPQSDQPAPPAFYAPPSQGYIPTAQPALDQHAYYATQSQHATPYPGHVHLVDAQPFPSLETVPHAPVPMPYMTDLSRNSTTSSVGSVRRPLPQPTRASSISSGPDSPTTMASRGSIRRDLPRPPSGASATISAGSMHAAAASNPAGAPSPIAGSVRLPPSALNRTESVRMAAEALMARGAPQRRSLRSALGTSTFSPPSSIAKLPPTPDASHGESATVSGSAPSSLPHAYHYDPARSLSQQPTPPQPPTFRIDSTSNSSAPASNMQRQPIADLTDTLAKVTVADDSARPIQPPNGSVPMFSFSADEPFEQPRRRRASGVSRTSPSKTPEPQVVPTISLPGEDDKEQGGPVIAVSGPDEHQSGPQISVTADDDDDVRSQSSSKGPSISVSFSNEPSVRSQRAGTSQSAQGAYANSGTETDRASMASVGGNGAGCFACRKWIAGKVVHALNTTFHPGCFVCAHCSEGLEHVAFYEHDGLPYCHFDYHELFSKRCFHCRTPIVDERYITVQDEQLTGQDGETQERCYHELHFFCANCGDPFMDPKATATANDAAALATTPADENGKIRHGGMEFIVHKGYPYCEKCHVNLHKPRCKRCKKPIVDDLISALGGKFHPACFQCAACSQPFSQTQFFVKDGKPYDQECYKVLLRNMV